MAINFFQGNFIPEGFETKSFSDALAKLPVVQQYGLDEHRIFLVGWMLNAIRFQIAQPELQNRKRERSVGQALSSLDRLERDVEKACKDPWVASTIIHSFADNPNRDLIKIDHLNCYLEKLRDTLRKAQALRNSRAADTVMLGACLSVIGDQFQQMSKKKIPTNELTAIVSEVAVLLEPWERSEARIAELLSLPGVRERADEIIDKIKSVHYQEKLPKNWH